MQTKLLRVLQEGEIRRVGGKDVIKVNVRIVSATNKNIYEMVRQGHEEGVFGEKLLPGGVTVIEAPPEKVNGVVMPVELHPEEPDEDFEGVFD